MLNEKIGDVESYIYCSSIDLIFILIDKRQNIDKTHALQISILNRNILHKFFKEKCGKYTDQQWNNKSLYSKSENIE